MPQARSGGGGKSGSGGGSRRTRSTGSRSTGAKSSGAGTRSSRAGAGARSTSSSTGSTRAKAGSADARFEAEAQRLRKLNERIIQAGRDAGETTLASYERVLKTIAGTIERGPGSSDVEWISNLATAQAKFIRDTTEAWTAAARKMLK
jgi:hypothetical protein